jgi:hypothetical protein
MDSEIRDLNTQTARGIVVLYAKYNDRYIPVKVTAEGILESNVSINASDIQIGAVEIKDSDTGDRVNVGLDQTKYAIYVQSESLNNNLQIANGFLNSNLNITTDIKNKLIEGITFKEWIWNTELLDVTTTEMEILKSIDLRLVKSKSFFIKNEGTNSIYLTLQYSLNDEDFINILSNQLLSSGDYVVFSEDKPMMSFRILAKIGSGSSQLKWCGYGLGG